MGDLLLRYLRLLLFNPKPMNQQEETEITEKGKQKLKGGRRFQGDSRNRSRRRESALISVIEEKSVECRRRLQICGFLNTPCANEVQGRKASQNVGGVLTGRGLTEPE